MTWRGNEAGADAAAEAARAVGRQAATHPLDVTDAAACMAFFEGVAEAAPLHTVVFAAGPPVAQAYISKLEPAAWAAALDAEAKGFFHVVRAALPALRAAKGSIVAITSAGIRRFPPGDILSVGPKAAIEALVRAIAREEGRYGVRANAVAPGVVDGGMFPTLIERGELSAGWVEAATKNTPLGRFAAPAESADAAVFLASLRASYLTGQVLVADGGYSL